MGSWVFELHLHDDETEKFISEALSSRRKQNFSDLRHLSRYVAQRMIDCCPELEQYRPETATKETH